MSMTIQSSVKDKILATPSKENVVTDVLSRKERVKPRRVRAMAITIQYRVRGMIWQPKVPLVGSEMDEAHASRVCVMDYGGRWGVHLPLAELTYNNSYHSSIKYALFEALYGRKLLIKEKFKAVRDRQRSYVGNRRKPLKFEVLRGFLRDERDSCSLDASFAHSCDAAICTLVGGMIMEMIGVLYVMLCQIFGLLWIKRLWKMCHIGRELSDADCEVLVNETFHEQTDDELTKNELKQVEADDQAIQTILLALPKDIYAVVDSCETAQEIGLRVQQMMKGSDIGIQEKKAKLFDEWERFTSSDEESIESYYHRFSKLMNDFKRKKHFPEKIACNLKFLNNLQPEWSRHITIVHQTKDLHTVDYTQLYDFLKYNQKEVDDLRAKRLAKTHDPLALMANFNNPYNYPVFHPDQRSPNPTTPMNMALVLMAKEFKLNYSTPTNNNQRISSNPRNRQIAQPGMNMGQDRQMQIVGGNGGNQFRQMQFRIQAFKMLEIRMDFIVVPGIANQNLNGNGNVVAARAKDNANRNNDNQIRCYNYRGLGHLAWNCIVRPRRRDAVYLQTQLLIAQKEEVGIQLQAEEFDLMADAADLDEIEEVNANCILMANLRRASTSGTQTDKAPVYDSDGSTEVHNYDNCYDNEKFNMFTQEEQYTELIVPIPEPHQVQQNDSNVIFEVSSVEQDGEYSIKQITTLNKEISNLNNQLSKEKSIVSSLLEEKKRFKSDFKIRKDKLLDKQIQLENKIKELDNILVKMGQSIQMMHMLSPKPDSFYHTEQKMALGYQNPFYLKQSQHKQQSLYNVKVLLEKHDPPVVYDSEETLQLAQESRLKMKQLNKEKKPTNYRKINHLLGVFVSQTAKSRKELYFSNTSKMDNVSKSISIPNEEFSDDTTPSVARKFLNEVKSTIVTLQRVVKQKMTLDIHNWSSSVHQEIHKIVKDEIFPIVNQVDARLQNFEIQFLKEAAKFVRDFKSLAKEADESLAKHKALELEIERLLRAVVSQDIMSIVQSNSVVDTSNLQTELERTKERFENCIIKKENEYAKLWNDCAKKGVNSNLNGLSSIRVDNTAKTKRPQPRSNTKNDRVLSTSKSSSIKKKVVEVEEHHRNLLLSKNKKHMSSECNNVKLAIRNDKSKVVCAMCKQCLITANHDVCVLNYVNDMNSRGNLKLLINFVWKFLGTVHFGNDHVAAILGYGDLQWGNILITRVYFVESLGHNLFLVGQFCDSDFEVAFKRNTCFIKNLEGVDLLKGRRTTNLYTINLHDMASASLIFLMARATSTKSWLWHQCLSYLNFDTINDLARNDLVTDLPKFKYHKEHLCPSCEQEKKQKGISPTQTSSKFKAEVTPSSYGFVWSDESQKYQWKAICFGDSG
ncbi:retrovirus-related pol polyprotein from transposon TNT 1-94 [Tanacetum coccineum]